MISLIIIANCFLISLIAIQEIKIAKINKQLKNRESSRSCFLKFFKNLK